MLRLVPRTGDFLVPGTPVLAVHGGAAPSRHALRHTVSVGVERTLFQDPAFGLPLTPLHHRDRRGDVRLVQQVPGWTDLVDLAFEEIRWCAAASPQVTRRMLAGLDDLLLLASEERKEPLLRHRVLLVEAVERTVPEAAGRAFALRPDRQGIG